MSISDEVWATISNEAPDIPSKVLTAGQKELRSVIKILKGYNDDSHNNSISNLYDRLKRVSQLKAKRFPQKNKRMSFAKATPQFIDGSKTVTRRKGWLGLCVGDELLAVNKCWGLKEGEKQLVIGRMTITNVRRERLDAIDLDDVAREGFPNMSTSKFIDMFCKLCECEPHDMVTRIEFRKLPDEGVEGGS